jgi:hypothetical protein
LTWVVCSSSSVTIQQSGLAGNLLAPFSDVHIQNAQVLALLSAHALVNTLISHLLLLHIDSR